jgi:hypothetical protein
MATRTATQVEVRAALPAILITWSDIQNGDDGSAFEAVGLVDKTFQITGTFGTSGSVTMQGSNDGSNWFSLTDPQGNAVTKTAAGGELLVENPRYIRPLCTAGDGTTALTVTVLAVRGSR